MILNHQGAKHAKDFLLNTNSFLGDLGVLAVDSIFQKRAQEAWRAC
jgi:hypothetical protein